MPRVLLVGWDGASWNQIHPLLDSGAMPNLARVVESGVMGDVAPLTPLCSPLLWTSVSTGQFADRHGILDYAEPDPVTGGIRPITRASLHAPQLWDLLAAEDIRSQAVGWPATHPAQGPATCISDGFAHGVARCLHPASLASRIEPLRFQPKEWTGSELSLFVPQLSSIDQTKDRTLARLAKALAETVSVHAAATTLMEACEWEFSAVWYGAIGAAHAITSPDSGAAYAEALPGTYRFLDLLLGRLLQLAGPETVTIIVSDRAAGEPEWRSASATGSRGILCATGPQIRPDELTFGAGLLDIAPTVLALFGFAAPLLPGRILEEICPAAPARSIRSVPASAPAESLQSLLDRDIRELQELGYRDAVAEARRPDADLAAARRDFNLARVLLSQDRPADSVPLLAKISSQYSGNLEFRAWLGYAYLQGGRLAECRALCESVLAENPDSPFMALAHATLAIAEGDLAGARAHLESGRGIYGIDAGLDSAMGVTCLRAGNWDEALVAFRSAIDTDPRLPAAHAGLARALFETRHFEEAAEAALDAIRLRYDLPDAHALLGAALRAMGREEAAAGAFAARDTLLRRDAAVS